MSEKQKKKGFLKKDLSLSKKSKWPEKTTMNFIQDKTEEQNKRSVVLFAVFLVFLAFFTKFCVMDPLVRISAAEAEYEHIQSSIDALKEANADYDTISAQYNEKVGTFLTDTEKLSMNRLDILSMIEQDIMPYVTVQSINISGSQISISTGSAPLQTISNVVTILQADERNAYVTVRTAGSSRAEDNVVANIEITYAGMTESAGN